MKNPICWLARRRLGPYHDGELAPGARARLRWHLDRCPGCTRELAGLTRLRSVLAEATPEPPEAAWHAFWPQVRARLAASPEPEPRWQWAWEGVVGHPRLALGSALVAVALAAVAVLAPWQGIEQHPSGPGTPPPMVATPGAGPGGSVQPMAQVVVQSVETTDPQSSVMVYTNPESDVTVVWVFGLERTEI